MDSQEPVDTVVILTHLSHLHSVKIIKWKIFFAMVVLVISDLLVFLFEFYVYQNVQDHKDNGAITLTLSSLIPFTSFLRLLYIPIHLFSIRLVLINRKFGLLSTKVLGMFLLRLRMLLSFFEVCIMAPGCLALFLNPVTGVLAFYTMSLWNGSMNFLQDTVTNLLVKYKEAMKPHLVPSNELFIW